MSGPRRILDPDRPKVPDVLPMVNAYMARPGNFGGGSLRSVLEGNDTSDAGVKWAREWAVQHGDVPGVELADVLIRMSPTQRGKLANLKTYHFEEG